MAAACRWAMNTWINHAFASIGIESPNFDKTIEIVPYWGLVTITKLTMASLLWSTGFFITNDEECWGTYSSYRFTTLNARCSPYAVVMSGLLACIGVISAQVGLEWALYQEKYKSSVLTLTITGCSTFFTFSLWSVFNLLAFSIAHGGGSHDDAYAQEYDLDVYMAGGILAMLLNASTFYLCYNSIRAFIIHVSLTETCTWLPYVTEKDLWRCDILYTCVLAGALYGLPFGALFADIFLATTHGEIALSNALGTLIGVVMIITPTHLLPVFVWVQLFSRDSEERVDGIDWETSLEGQQSAEIMNELHDRL